MQCLFHEMLGNSKIIVESHGYGVGKDGRWSWFHFCTQKWKGDAEELWGEWGNRKQNKKIYPKIFWRRTSTRNVTYSFSLEMLSPTELLQVFVSIFLLRMFPWIISVAVGWAVLTNFTVVILKEGWFPIMLVFCLTLVYFNSVHQLRVK